MPELAILFKPTVHRLERYWVKLIQAIPPAALLMNKVRSPQDAQVLRNGRARDRERLCDRSGRLQPSYAQKIE